MCERGSKKACAGAPTRRRCSVSPTCCARSCTVILSAKLIPHSLSSAGIVGVVDVCPCAGVTAAGQGLCSAGARCEGVYRSALVLAPCEGASLIDLSRTDALVRVVAVGHSRAARVCARITGNVIEAVELSYVSYCLRRIDAPSKLLVFCCQRVLLLLVCEFGVARRRRCCVRGHGCARERCVTTLARRCHPRVASGTVH